MDGSNDKAITVEKIVCTSISATVQEHLPPQHITSHTVYVGEPKRQQFEVCLEDEEVSYLLTKRYVTTSKDKYPSNKVTPKDNESNFRNWVSTESAVFKDGVGANMEYEHVSRADGIEILGIMSDIETPKTTGE